MLIRVATPSDAIPLAELKRDTFRETFLQDGFNIDYPPHDLAAYETQAYSVETVTGQLNDPQCRTWVAESDDGRLVGYAHAGPCKLPHPEVTDGAGKSIRSTFGAARKEPAPGARCSIPHLTIWPRNAPARCGSACGPATRRPSPSTRRPVSGRSARTISRSGKRLTWSSSTVADLRSGMPAKPRRRRTGASRMIARRPCFTSAGPFGQRWRLMRERPPIGRRHL